MFTEWTNCFPSLHSTFLQLSTWLWFGDAPLPYCACRSQVKDNQGLRSSSNQSRLFDPTELEWDPGKLPVKRDICWKHLATILLLGKAWYWSQLREKENYKWERLDPDINSGAPESIHAWRQPSLFSCESMSSPFCLNLEMSFCHWKIR